MRLGQSGIGKPEDAYALGRITMPSSKRTVSDNPSDAGQRPVQNRWLLGLRVLLWVFGVSGLMAVVPAVMPRSWLVAAVAHAEPGTPVLLLVEYLARSLSALYCLLGGIMCLCAMDPLRHAPIIRWLGGFAALSGTAACILILLAPYQKNVVVWLLAFDAGLIALFGAAVLTMQAMAGRS